VTTSAAPKELAVAALSEEWKKRYRRRWWQKVIDVPLNLLASYWERSSEVSWLHRTIGKQLDKPPVSVVRPASEANYPLEDIAPSERTETPMPAGESPLVERAGLSMRWKLVIAAVAIYVILRVYWVVRTEGW